MNEAHIRQISEELGITQDQTAKTAALLDEGATVPFIARYRKEVTGSLDEVAVTHIRDGLAALKDLDDRKEAVLKSLEKNGHLTEELKEKIACAETLSEVEDIYLPYRPKRRTKAAKAREKGLEPLALTLMEQMIEDVEAEAVKYMDPEKEIESAHEALSGARDILAEIFTEDADARAEIRELFFTKSMIKSRVVAGKEEDGEKFKDYFEWDEPAAAAPSHRILAMRRGEAEDILNMDIEPDADTAVSLLEYRFLKPDGSEACKAEVSAAIIDGYKRLLSRSMETETRLMLKEKADKEAIRIFTENLRQLLMAAPLGSKRVMGVDPGFRTGCKIVCLDAQGKLLANDTAYLHMTERKDEEGANLIRRLCEKYKIEAVAVGNGTAGRETEAFVRKLNLGPSVTIIMVNESGASIYSASETAREEFPDLDLTVRGAVSIGRRLMDPLAELVKIDPKSIGVGQYQHDVDQNALKQSLDDVVVSCVNGVGVDVNTASDKLLTYVSGLGPVLAKNIISYRNENGPFKNRAEIKNVKRLGPKAFEQAAGFLRIQNGDNPLDKSAVHPESYPIVDRMAGDLSVDVLDLLKNPERLDAVDLSRYVSDAVGMPTLTDIVSELKKPGRDPREKFEVFSFDGRVGEIADLREGMKLPGIVTNITAFGAFVDIGVHQDGLVHISEMADRFVKDPNDIVKVSQKVSVTVLSVDEKRKRIALSMKTDAAGTGKDRGRADASQGFQSKTMPPNKRTIKGGNKKPKKDGNRPFHNPFADLFKQ